MFRHRVRLDRVQRAVEGVEIPEAVFKTCPWQPRERVELRLWHRLRSAGAARAVG